MELERNVNYAEALENLLSLTDLERVSGQPARARRYDLSRMEAFLERLDNPHRDTPTVHITGTKGKGSTAALISSVLSAQGYRPGLFTSPHLHTFRERIRVDGEPVSEEEFASLVEMVWPAVEAMNDDGDHGPVTTFELLTAMAFCHFRERRAGFQVVEVGLGGRLDATNLVQPQVCVITSISLDHTAILGDTVERIARDKAGIVKSGSVAVSSPQPPGVMTVLAEACRSQGAILVPVEQECEWTLVGFNLDGQTFTVFAPWGEYRLQMPMLGGHQLENAATALTALQVLNELGFTVSRDSVSRGFRSVSWPARLEVLSREPLIIADGAHNPYSVAKLREALGVYFPARRPVYVVGLSVDKNITGIVDELAQDGATIVVTRSRHPRAVSQASLAQEFRRAGVEVTQIESVEAAINHAIGVAQEQDFVIVAGSLFVAAEAREALLGIKPEVYPSLLPTASVP